MDHAIWGELLQKHVNQEGWVNYEGFIQDSFRLNEYLNLLENNPPNPANWQEAESLAFWINAYNAFTVRLIIRHYPVASIRDIGPALSIPFVNSTWDIPFIRIGGIRLTLNQLEHSILRKQFSEPRIHFAIVCASFSCPPLLNEPFLPDILEAQLEAQSYRFINDPRRNRIHSETQADLSQLFNWYKNDFTHKGNLLEFINQYSNVKLQKGAKLSFLPYDWGLNSFRPGENPVR